MRRAAITRTRRDKQIVMTVEHRAAPGLNDIEVELADRGQGLALRPCRAGPAEAAPESETPEQRIVQALAEAQTPLSQRQIRERAATRHKTVGAILGSSSAKDASSATLRAATASSKLE